MARPHAKLRAAGPFRMPAAGAAFCRSPAIAVRRPAEGRPNATNERL